MRDDGAVKLFSMLAGVAAMICLAVPANADPGGVDAEFVTALNKAGITYGSPDQAVAAGRQVCTLMDSGQQDIDVVRKVAEQNPGFTISGAAKFAAIAASAYCPEYVVGSPSQDAN